MSRLAFRPVAQPTAPRRAFNFRRTLTLMRDAHTFKLGADVQRFFCGCDGEQD
jgi:hypothetical protein